MPHDPIPEGDPADTAGRPPAGNRGAPVPPSGEPRPEPRWPRERLGFAALALFALAPLVLAGVWRPMVHALGAEGDASGLASCGLAVTAVAVLTFVASFGRRAARWLPGAAAGVSALLLGVGLAGGLPSIGARASALLAVALFSTALLPWLVRRAPAEIDGLASRRRGSVALLVVLCVVVATGNWNRGVFMADATRVDRSLDTSNAFFTRHSCLTAYIEGARLATEGVDNLYDIERWPDLSHTATFADAPAPYAPFHLDAFAYPPPFLLLPRFLLLPLGDFAAQRAFWFGLTGLFIAAGLWTVATWIGGRAGARTLLLSPLVWLSPAVLSVLQVGNVHAVVIVAAMLAMVAFETKRPAIGGALLAFAIVSKISPGLLIVLLLFQRRFREVLWTALFGLVFMLAGLAVFGAAPFIAFVSYELPRLSSGEALSFLTGSESVPINLAPFGVPFKLAHLGLRLADPWAAARLISTVFTASVLVLTAWGARNRGGRRATAATWAAVLTLASLRSPLAPAYVTLGVAWLLAIRSIKVRGTPRAVAEALLWIALLFPPLGDSAPALILSLLQQCLLIVFAAYFLLRRAPADAAPLSEPSPVT